MSEEMNSKRIGIARILSKMGYCSRAEGERLVAAGRVTLNRVVVRDPEAPVVMARDVVAVDGKTVEAARQVYWVMHKPAGIVTTANDEKGRRTVYDLLPAGMPWISPVGRLDMESEGLLLLTNDTVWAARITSPESHVDKTYHVQIDRAPDHRILAALHAGVEDGGDFLKAKKASPLRSGENWLEIVLDEGKNRHIRRMLDVLGVPVLRLVRVAVGQLLLGDLPPGAARPLTDVEKALLSSGA
jgi:23S rRNA pseudouridine2605 synthase